MSLEYDKYLRRHRTNVMDAFIWLKDNIFNNSLSNIYPNYQDGLLLDISNLKPQIENHDASKNEDREYFPYDDYFYNRKASRTSFVVDEFNEAFLMHIHKNPHHWQHWVLIPDSENLPQKAIFMPFNYIIEMVCDWFSFSLESGVISAIFDFYLERKNYIILHPKSREFLEVLLYKMERIINEKDERGNYTCGLWSQYTKEYSNLSDTYR